MTRLICRAKIKIKEVKLNREKLSGIQEVEETYGGSNGYRHGSYKINGFRGS